MLKVEHGVWQGERQVPSRGDDRDVATEVHPCHQHGHAGSE